MWRHTTPRARRRSTSRTPPGYRLDRRSGVKSGAVGTRVKRRSPTNIPVLKERTRLKARRSIQPDQITPITTAYDGPQLVEHRPDPWRGDLSPAVCPEAAFLKGGGGDERRVLTKRRPHHSSHRRSEIGETNAVLKRGADYESRWFSSYRNRRGCSHLGCFRLPDTGEGAGHRPY